MASPQHDICAICLEEPKYPRSLPTCTHLFCAKCLANYVKRHETQKSVACPTCTMACPIQTLKDTVTKGEAAGTSDRLTESKLCTLCSYKNEDSKAEFACANCDSMSLCPDCASIHKKKSFFKHHNLKSLASKVSYKLKNCQRHGGRSMRLLCLECDQTICEVCASIEHTDHEIGDICDLMKQVSDATEPLATARSEIDKAQQELNVIENKQEDVILAVTNQVELLKKDLDKRRDELISTVKQQSGVKHIGEEAFALLGQLEEALELGQDVLSSDIAAKHQYEFALSIRDKVLKAGTDTGETVVTVRDMLQNASVPKFIATKDMTVGNLELMHIDSSGNALGKLGVVGKAYVRLQLGGKYAIEPCYKVGNVGICSEANDGTFKTMIVVSSRQDGLLDRLYSAKDNNLLLSNEWCIQHAQWVADQTYTTLYSGPRDFIVNNDGTSSFFSMRHKLKEWKYSVRTAKIVPVINILDNENLVSADRPIIDSLVDYEAVSICKTKLGHYMVLSIYVFAEEKPLKLSLIKPDNSVFVQSVVLPKELAALDKNSLKMRCVESLDLILLFDSEMVTVLSLTLEVKHDTSKFNVGTLGNPTHYLKTQDDLCPPLEGHCIMDVCCSVNKVYLCTKRGDRIAAGPIKLYEVTFIDGRWEYADVTLLDPAGKEYDALAENELLRLGTHKDTLMCMVYSPFSPAQQIEFNQPGMSISWWFGKLP